MRLKIQVVGSIDDAVDALGFWRDLLDLRHVCFFFDYPGLRREDIDEQMHLVVEEVFPRLGEPVERRPLPDLAPWAEVGAGDCDGAPHAHAPPGPADRRHDDRRRGRRGRGHDRAGRPGPRSVRTRHAPSTSRATCCCPRPREPHAHLDKAFLAERIPNPSGDLAGAIVAMDANRPSLTADDIAERAERAARMMVANGITAIRSHADTMTGHGLRSVEGLVAARERLAGLVDLQIVALVSWPVTGTTGAEHRALLAAALEAGADVVGGCPHLDDDPDGANEVLLEIAADDGRMVDLHTDETLDPCVLGLRDLAARVAKSGFPHRVAASHCVSLGVQPLEAAARGRRGGRGRRRRRRDPAPDQPLPPGP